MSKLDLVVFGATGHTGKRAIEELARGSRKYAGVSWAIAGRSQKKLEDILTETTKKTGEDVTPAEVIIADVSDYDSLKRMCARARVVVNACGPYRHFGEPVVKAAIEAKAHYVDVSGEPQFIETMQLKYDKEAQEAGVYIISACGLDSIPNDMGVIFLEQNFPGTLNSVESYLSSKIHPDYSWEALKSGCINYGTWESLVYSLANHGELSALRKKLYPERLPSFKPKLENRGFVHKRLGGWCVPFPGADASVVHRTQRALWTAGQRPVQFRPYVRLDGLLPVFLLAFFGSVLVLFSKFDFTRKLLLDHPRLFSCGVVSRGPKQAVSENSSFEVRLLGRGWAPGQDVATISPDTTLAAKVAGTDPGYGFTVIALLQSALTIIREQDKMPNQGGVLTTGFAFRNTSLIRNLQENNVTFELLENK